MLTVASYYLARLHISVASYYLARLPVSVALLALARLTISVASYYLARLLLTVASQYLAAFAEDTSLVRTVLSIKTKGVGLKTHPSVYLPMYDRLLSPVVYGYRLKVATEKSPSRSGASSNYNQNVRRFIYHGY